LLAQDVYDDDAVEERAEELEDAREVLAEAAQVVRQMNAEAEMRQLRDRARGVHRARLRPRLADRRRCGR
jgi:hypothetical protein